MGEKNDGQNSTSDKLEINKVPGWHCSDWHTTILSIISDGHSSVPNQGTYRSLLYPFIYIKTQNGKAPTSVLLFYCFETVKGLDT